MNIFATRNSAALQILQGSAQLFSQPQVNGGNSPSAGRGFNRPLLPPANDVAQRAAAKIAEIINASAGQSRLPEQQTGSLATAVKSYVASQSSAESPEGVRHNPFAQQFANATASGKDDAVIHGGDGGETLSAWANATVTSGKGNDVISVHNDGTVDSGAGDDTVYAYRRANITTGDGNDRVHTSDNSAVNSRAGDDIILGNAHMMIDAGDGNDEVRTYDHANIDLGAGNDLAVVLGYSTVRGGAGDDMLIDSELNLNKDALYGHSTLDGGEGNDYIQASINSNVSGGVGDDTIRLTNIGTTVNFRKGDGNDEILAHDDFTLNLAGYDNDDVVVTKADDKAVISFKGSDDTITLDLGRGATAHLTFENGATLDVKGSDTIKAFDTIFANPDRSWRREDRYYVDGQSSSSKVIQRTAAEQEGKG